MAFRSRPVEAVDEQDIYPAEDGAIVHDGRHTVAAHILSDSLRRWLEEKGRDAYIGIDNGIYYQFGDPQKVVGPDFFVILDAHEDSERDCWRVWNEDGKLPQVIMEFVSKRSGKKDRVINFAIYQDALQTPNYFIWDNRRRRFDGFHLRDGKYVPLEPDSQGRFWCEALRLYVGIQDGWIRWFEPDGQMLLTGQEIANQQTEEARLAKDRADQAEHRADQAGNRALEAEQQLEAERQRADQLAARLRALGLEP